MNTTMTDRTVDAVSTHVVEAIADATNTDPFSLEPPLHHSVDLEALDRLFRADTSGLVLFEYEGHRIGVDSDGTVTVDGTTYDPDSRDRP